MPNIAPFFFILTLRKDAFQMRTASAVRTFWGKKLGLLEIIA